MKHRSLFAVGLTIALAASVSACGSGSGAASGSDDYRVIVLGGLSAQGALADQADTSVNAAKAGVDLVNSSGGIDGHHVTIQTIDDTGDPTAAVSKLQAAIAKNPPDLVLNSGPSSITQATLPILNAHHILSFNIAPTADSANPAKYPLNFDLSPAAADQIKAYVPYLKKMGYASVGILHGNDAWGTEYGEQLESTLSAAGVKVTTSKSYDVSALDMTGQIQAVQATHPDALIINAYGAPVGYILNGINKLGWDVPVIGDTSVSATGLTTTPAPQGLLGSDAVKHLVMEVYTSTTHDPSATVVNDAVRRMMHYGPLKTTLIMAFNYDGLPLVAAAAEAAKSTKAEDIAAKLVDPAAEAKAKTAILTHYGFTATAHHPTNVEDQYSFIPPAAIKDGQFQ